MLMNIFTSFTKALIISAVATAIMTAPSYAMMAQECLGTEDAKYPNISTTGGNGTDFPVYCQRIKIDDEYISLYGKTSADCTQASKLANDPEACGNEDDDEEIDEEPMADDEDGAAANADDEDEASKGTATTGSNDTKETHMEDSTSPLLIVSLIANGILLVAVIVLVILLTTKTSNKSSNQDSSDTSTPSEPSEPTTPTAPTAPTESVTTTEPTEPTTPTTPAE